MTKVLDHGIVEVIDHMGSDQSIERAARVSYGGDKVARTVEETTKLINYLVRHEHDSPLEHAVVQMYVKCPIFVARQWMRHRMWSYNEVSYRYKQASCEFYTPEVWRGQASDNKQGSDGVSKYNMGKWWELGCDGVEKTITEACQDEYTYRLVEGVARELARTCLPLATYTEFYATVDLRNLLHFIRLRQDSHAQQEIRVYADALATWVSENFPITWGAFQKYRMRSNDEG